MNLSAVINSRSADIGRYYIYIYINMRSARSSHLPPRRHDSCNCFCIFCTCMDRNIRWICVCGRLLLLISSVVVVQYHFWHAASCIYLITFVLFGEFCEFICCSQRRGSACSTWMLNEATTRRIWIFLWFKFAPIYICVGFAEQMSVFFLYIQSVLCASSYPRFYLAHGRRKSIMIPVKNDEFNKIYHPIYLMFAKRQVAQSQTYTNLMVC